MKNNRIGFGDRLKSVRKSNKLTQMELSHRLGVSKSSVINYESGKRVPDVEYLFKFIDELGVDANWLFSGSSNEGGLPVSSQRLAVDAELRELLNHLNIPTIRMLVMAEYHRVSSIFSELIKEYDQSQSAKKDSVNA